MRSTRVLEAGQDAVDEILHRFREQFDSTMAELECFYTLSTNGFEPRFICTDQNRRTPDLHASGQCPITIEVAACGENAKHRKRNEFFECFYYDEMRPKVLALNLKIALDVRDPVTNDVQNLARRLAKKAELREGTFVVNQEEVIVEVADDPHVDLVEAGPSICVYRLSSDACALSPIRADDIAGTTLESALRRKLKRRQQIPDAVPFILIDVTRARRQLMGAGFRACTERASALADRWTGIGAVAIRCTSLPAGGRVRRECSIAWHRDGSLGELAKNALSEDGELPDHLS